MTLFVVGSVPACVRHLAYPGRVDVVEPASPEVATYRVLRMRIDHADQALSVTRRNQLGRVIARVVERSTHFDEVLPYSTSASYADRAPVLELELYRYETPVVDRDVEVGIEGRGRLIAPDERVLGRFELESSPDYDWTKLLGVVVRSDAPDDRFELIADRTAQHIVAFLSGIEEPG